MVPQNHGLMIGGFRLLVKLVGGTEEPGPRPGAKHGPDHFPSNQLEVFVLRRVALWDGCVG